MYRHGDMQDKLRELQEKVMRGDAVQGGRQGKDCSDVLMVLGVYRRAEIQFDALSVDATCVTPINRHDGAS